MRASKLLGSWSVELNAWTLRALAKECIELWNEFRMPLTSIGPFCENCKPRILSSYAVCIWVNLKASWWLCCSQIRPVNFRYYQAGDVALWNASIVEVGIRGFSKLSQCILKVISWISCWLWKCERSKFLKVGDTIHPFTPKELYPSLCP
jgi:hypothetical protein